MPVQELAGGRVLVIADLPIHAVAVRGAGRLRCTKVATGAAPDVACEKLEVENRIQLMAEPNTLTTAPPHHRADHRWYRPGVG